LGPFFGEVDLFSFVENKSLALKKGKCTKMYPWNSLRVKDIFGGRGKRIRAFP